MQAPSAENQAESGRGKCIGGMRGINFMRCAKNATFSTLSTELSTKTREKTRFPLDFAPGLWITFDGKKVIHSRSDRIRALFPQDYPGLFHREK